MDQRNQAFLEPWRDSHFFLTEHQQKGAVPAWLDEYTYGIDSFFHGEYLAAKTDFEAAIKKGCPPTVYVWLLCIAAAASYTEAQKATYQEKLTPEILKTWAESTVPEELNALAFCYSAGAGVEEDLERAKSIWKAAADKGYAVAQLNVAFFFLKGGDRTKAIGYLQAAADQELFYAKFSLLQIQRDIRLDLTQNAGGWLVYPIGLLSMLLVIGAGGLAAYFNQSWFTNFSHIFAGTFLTAGLIAAAGAVVWTVGSLLRLPVYIQAIELDYSEWKASFNDNDSFIFYLFDYLVSWFLINWKIFTGVIVGSVVMAVVLFSLQSAGSTALIDAMSSALLSGLTSLAGFPGLNFLSPLLTSSFTLGFVQAFFILSPLILFAAIDRVVSTFFPPENRPEEKSTYDEDGASKSRNGIELKDNLHDRFLSQTNPEPENEYVYTPKQEEYAKNNPGRYLARAMHDFTPERSDQYQLTFVKGDLIWVVESDPEEDWWIGQMEETGEKGYFPVKHVEILKRNVAGYTTTALNLSSSSSGSD